MELTIRDATEADAEGIAALLADLGYPIRVPRPAGFESRPRGFTKRLAASNATA